MERHRRVLQRIRTETLDERGAREDDRVARLDRLPPHLRQHVGIDSERYCFARRRLMDEVGELAGLVTWEEQPCAAHEEDLRATNARRVQLVVHDNRTR